VAIGDVCVVEPVVAEDDSVDVDGNTVVLVDEFVVVDGVVEPVDTVDVTGVVVTGTSVVVAGVPRQ
jgi:hypothetical protein